MNTEASVIKSLLDSYSIPCDFTSDLPSQIYPLSGEGLTEIRIYVPAPLAEAARKVLAEHRRRDATLRLVEADEKN